MEFSMRIITLLVVIFGVHFVNPQTCDSNAVCVGYFSGFNCSCNTGYKGSNGGCVNIDECVELPPVCEDAETCNDIIGSYNCTCGDIDTICHEQAVCVNGTNSTDCFCIEGYTGNGTSCYDIDECVERLDNCSGFATCRNSIGSYDCTCNTGFEGNGFVCTDVDECTRDTHNCILPLTCNNTVGAYECVCGEERFCHENGYCANLDNSTFCVCNLGYIGNGVVCSDLNECEGKTECHTNASCKNTPGSYRCVCNQGFEGDGKECSNGNMAAVSLGLILLSFTSSLLSRAFC